MISPECSSHFMKAYSDYQNGQWNEDKTSSSASISSRNSNASDHWKRCAELARLDASPTQENDTSEQWKPCAELARLDASPKQESDGVLDDVINKLTQIPLVQIQIDDGNESAERAGDDEFKSVDAFTNETSDKDNSNNSINDDIPTLWKKDVRDRRKSINSALLSPIHLDNLNRQHRRASLNPESFDGLRQLSMELRDKRNLQSSASFDSNCSEEDCRESDEDNDSNTDININSSRISQTSNVLLQRSRRLSVDNISLLPKPPTDLPTNKSRKLSLMQKSNSYSSLPKIDNKFLVNKTQPFKNDNKLDVPVTKTATLAAPADARRERRSSVNLLQKPQIRNRRLSLQPQDDEIPKDISKRRPSLMNENNVRRASRIISKFEQNLIQKEIALTGGKAQEEDPLKELRNCRYLRQSYKAEAPDRCPCHNCEKRKSSECLSSSYGSSTLCLTSS